MSGSLSGVDLSIQRSFPFGERKSGHMRGKQIDLRDCTIRVARKSRHMGGKLSSTDPENKSPKS